MVAPLSPRPAIGLCVPVERARWGPWEDEALLLPRAYADAVLRAGGLPLLLVPEPAATAHPDELLDFLDGLLLAGGVDVGADEVRDAFEMALGLRALERDLPVLGICRGLQVLNVARGGTLVPHVPDLVGHERHLPTPGSFEGSEHDVALEPDSLAARVAGEARHRVRTHHHQAADAVGVGLQISGRDVEDGLPEALEAPDRTFALGVQWHPEADPESPVIGAFVAAAAEAAAQRSRSPG